MKSTAIKSLAMAMTSIALIACGEQVNSKSTDTNNQSLSTTAAPIAAQTTTAPTAIATETVEQTAVTASQVAQASSFVQGTHYDIIDPPIAVSGEKVQVAELFWYGCGHCFNLEPHMIKWRQNIPANAELIEVPAVFGNQWKFHAQAFYTSQALGIQKESHQKIFDSIHVQKKRISKLSQLQDLFETLGQSREKTEAAFQSFAVDANLRNAALFAQKSGASAVPTIIVDGKYRTSVGQAGGYDQLLQLMNHLVEKAQGDRQG